MSRAWTQRGAGTLGLLLAACLGLVGCMPGPSAGGPLEKATAVPSGQSSFAVGAATLRSRLFIENRGQDDPSAIFTQQSGGLTTRLTARGLRYTLAAADAPPPDDRPETPTPSAWMAGAHATGTGLRAATDRRSAVTGDSLAGIQTVVEAIDVELVGARGDLVPASSIAAPTRVGFFQGTEDRWITNVPASYEVRYQEVWPGVDLLVTTEHGRPKTTYVVKPGADPAAITLQYRGAEPRIGEDGDLRLPTPHGTLRESAPVAYQDRDGARTPVPAAFALQTEPDGLPATVAFEVGAYDPGLPLAIDPAVAVEGYGGYIGGNQPDRLTGIAVDDEGHAYIAGLTRSTPAGGFTVVGGPDLTFNGGAQDVFVGKIAADGSSFVYLGYVGGSGYDVGFDLALAPDGSAVVVGVTESFNFPTRLGPTLRHQGREDAFVLKVLPDGSGLAFSGFLGGSQDDGGHAVTVDRSGDIYVAGRSESRPSDGFPVRVGPTLIHRGDQDAFVGKIRGDGREIEYLGYIGGSEYELATGIAVEPGCQASCAAYVGGSTHSSERRGFPVIVGPDITYNGGRDAFVAKVRPDGAGFAYSGYVGGSEDDFADDIAVGTDGSAYLVGSTSSASTFPLAVGPGLRYGGQGDAYISRLRPDGAGFIFSGVFGGSRSDQALGIALAPDDTAYVAGWTHSTVAEGFPARNGFDHTYAGGDGDGILVVVQADGTSILSATYLGGSDRDIMVAVALDRAGNAYLAGETASSESEGFPVLRGPDLTFNDPRPDGDDGVVVKLGMAALGPGARAHADSGDDSPRKETEAQRQQRERTDRSSRDDVHTEGQVVGVSCDSAPPSVSIANRDGIVEIRLGPEAAATCGGIAVGDYLEAEGEKQHEQLFDADEVTRRR